MLTQIVMNADIMQSLSGLGHRFANRLFRPSGWSIPDDTDSGISFGEAVDGGAGYMEMDLRDQRGAAAAKYELRGGYVELGVGIGEISKLQGIIKKVVKWMPKGARPSSDIVVMPGGSITQFIIGPMQDRGTLEPGDFKWSSWIYIHIGAEIAVFSGDIGLMFLVDHAVGVDLLIAGATPMVGAVVTDLMINCLAWAPYYGTALGLGAGGKVAIRVVQSVQMNAA